MKTTSLLPFARVITYDLGKKNFDKVFADEAAAKAAIARCGTKLWHIHRIEKVNGTWRTDWELGHD